MSEVAVSVIPDELDGGFIAEVVDLPGCMGQGETEAEAAANAREVYRELTAACGFLNCTTLIVKEYPWQMCDPCYDRACEVDDSNLHDLDDVADEFGISL